ncbi:L,D-transpeptidase family protein [Novosphingobium jiangmenense]|uniref:L,D-transpeptidase family protein n=1 Tax=Novosphingobium jiangmenense TaxID=2791981 RepID=A0ABS0HDZ5_9SPHN|nr:L,D-transpeptidase family protein [Novosphingobium jiangmenense]MBF9150484.1 L,D-transpeptidase family protein [Novosphingobium jiangmenense]
MIRSALLPLALMMAGDAAAEPSTEASAIASVRVEKAARRLLLLDESGHVSRAYGGIQLGSQPVGAKQFEGDGRTPEGRYVIDYGNPSSAYHLSLHITYPNKQERAHAESLGRSPGGEIFIHGQPNFLDTGRIAGDWTAGCIALANEEIEEIWQLVPDGTPVEIVP